MVAVAANLSTVTPGGNGPASSILNFFEVGGFDSNKLDLDLDDA